MFDKLPETDQKILLEQSQNYFSRLMKLSREENLRSVESLKKNGVELIPSPPQKEMQRFYQAGKQARRLLVPRLYSLELVEAVEKALEHFRENKKQ